MKIPQTRARKGKGQRKGPKRLEVDRRGVWLIQGNRRTKVGLVVIDAEAYDVDPRNVYSFLFFSFLFFSFLFFSFLFFSSC